MGHPHLLVKQVQHAAGVPPQVRKQRHHVVPHQAVKQGTRTRCLRVRTSVDVQLGPEESQEVGAGQVHNGKQVGQVPLHLLLTRAAEEGQRRHRAQSPLRALVALVLQGEPVEEVVKGGPKHLGKLGLVGLDDLVVKGGQHPLGVAPGRLEHRLNLRPHLHVKQVARRDGVSRGPYEHVELGAEEGKQVVVVPVQLAEQGHQAVLHFLVGK
mmetsp:Transcript_20117/g.29082  ORF Transcript_20117/g.29082 Transcript_20117/m.29082 type:complete len:211 (-) Transcript_20117:354-986(-)